MTIVAPEPPRPSSPVAPLLLTIALVLSAIVALRGITNEAAVSLQGDMPRYLMDGVFLRDLLVAPHGWSFDGLLRFAQRYYVQYPALSVGHHPPLLPAVLVPFFAVFGVSVETARIVIAGFFMLSVLLLFTFVRQLYDGATAGWACLLFATMPYLAEFGQSVLSEMTAIACVLAVMNVLLRFRQTGRPRDYLWLVVLAVVSLSARQLALFMFPAYALLLLQDHGWRRFRQPRILLPTVIGIGLLALVALATLILSPFNVDVIRRVLAGTLGHATTLGLVAIIVREQLHPALLFLMLAGIAWAILDRDRRVVVPIAWMLSVLLGVVFVTGPLEPARYSILAVPAYCLAGASLWARARNRTTTAIVAAAIIAAAGWQAVGALAVRPVGAHGYEQAATYVIEHSQAPTVLYTGVVDTGYFVFFVRKHDPAQRLVVLRSDKILTTSSMGHLSVEDRITDRGQIYDVLREFGTRYVVIEDVRSGTRVIDWLRDELHTAHFAERQRYPIDTRDRRLRGADLVVYEYLEATPPAAGAQIDVKLPIVNREIRVPLSDFQRTSASPAGSGQP
jgi:hypothetical protein